MSIIINAMTKKLVVVASDSLMLHGISNEKAKKIYRYNSHLVMYGVGNAGILFGFFDMLNNIKKELGDKFSYNNAIDAINFWKEHIESTPNYKGIFAAVGVCGIVDHIPKSTTILIDSCYFDKFENKLAPPTICHFILFLPQI